MFIIDFDQTIFETRPGFVRSIVESLSKFGVSEDQFIEAYNKVKSKDGLAAYNSQRHARELAKYGFDEKEILQFLKSTNEKNNLEKYIFDDSIFFLESLKKFKETMVLLTLGDPEFQAEKIYGLGLEKYFDHLFLRREKKVLVMQDILTHHKGSDLVWFINDKVEETVEVFNKFSFIKPVLKKSTTNTETEYEESGFPYFKTLTEIYEYIRDNR